MNIKHFLPVASLAVLLGASTAVMAETSAKPKSADTATAIADAAITVKVKAKFMGDDRLKGTDISVITANGVVSLTGNATSSEAKAAAEEMTRQVEGVRNVDNLIVAPSVVGTITKDVKKAAHKTERVASDSWITTKVKSTLLADKVTKGLKISVNTTNRVVVLAGSVETQEAFDQAVTLAKQVKGVESVDSSGLKIVAKS